VAFYLSIGLDPRDGVLEKRRTSDMAESRSKLESRLREGGHKLSACE